MVVGDFSRLSRGYERGKRGVVVSNAEQQWFGKTMLRLSISITFSVPVIFFSVVIRAGRELGVRYHFLRVAVTWRPISVRSAIVLRCHCTNSRKGNVMDAHLMNRLNDILRHEWTGVAQYAQAGFVVSGFWREVYASMFFGNAKESYGHARLIGDKIVALGGVPTIERNPVQQSNDLAEMLNHALAFESAAVKLYTEAISCCGDDRALEVFLEDILKEEQAGVDEISKLLRNQSAAAGSSGSAPSKVG